MVPINHDDPSSKLVFAVVGGFNLEMQETKTIMNFGTSKSEKKIDIVVPQQTPIPTIFPENCNALDILFNP